MKQALLDTDSLSEYFRGNKKVIENIGEYLATYPYVNVSIITYYEILSGLLYKDARKQLEKFYDFIELNSIVHLTTGSVKLSAEIQADLRKKGTEIGHTDTLIAGIAIANNLQLVTNNVRHFKRIKALDVANWTK